MPMLPPTALLLQVLAEKAAWKMAKEHGIDLVTINPVFVVGPVISKRTDATTVKLLVVRPPTICVLSAFEFTSYTLHIHCLMLALLASANSSLVGTSIMERSDKALVHFGAG